MLSTQHLNIPKRLQLADESNYKGGDIDIIVGAELFYQLLCIGQHRLGESLPILQRTWLGWVVSGSIPVVNQPSQVVCNFALNTDNILNDIESHRSADLSDDDIQMCEKTFATHTRCPDGISLFPYL